ncbi:MAG: DHH family phosphoesterase [archaeon]|nr:DHH family phosphoesterase [archaeon]
MITSKKLRKFPLIETKRLRYAIVLCHRNADVDAYCSAYAVTSFLKQINPEVNVSIASPKGLSTLTRRVQDRFRIDFIESPNILKADLIVVVDTGDLSLLEGWGDELKSTKAPRIFIDHHPLTESIKSVADLLLIDEKASSCSEIIYEIFKTKKVKLMQDVAQALLTGILFDSQHLTIADCRTIKIVTELCKRGAFLALSKELLEMPRSMPEIIAHMKAAKRLRACRAREWIIAITNVSSFQASVANAILDLGADLAFALGERENEVRGSLRATQSFYSKTKVHLGIDIAQKVASILEGKGGGHSTAASLSSPCTIDETVSCFLSTLSEKLKIKIKEIQ